MAIKKFKRPYEEVKNNEYCKRLINLNYALRFYKHKFVKSRKKHKRFKPLRHAKRILKRDEYKTYKLFYFYFKIDKRLHIINANKQLLKYRCDNLYFLSNYMRKNLKPMYKDFNKCKYTVLETDLLGTMVKLMLTKYERKNDNGKN